eukprot:1161592-Pelagomonas_calceolata.AAC.18
MAGAGVHSMGWIGWHWCTLQCLNWMVLVHTAWVGLAGGAGHCVTANTLNVGMHKWGIQAALPCVHLLRRLVLAYTRAAHKQKRSGL